MMFVHPYILSGICGNSRMFIAMRTALIDLLVIFSQQQISKPQQWSLHRKYRSEYNPYVGVSIIWDSKKNVLRSIVRHPLLLLAGIVQPIVASYSTVQYSTMRV